LNALKILFGFLGMAFGVTLFADGLSGATAPSSPTTPAKKEEPAPTPPAPPTPPASDPAKGAAS
jgi:hypothetical protein